MTPVAIVTGASAGIGVELARVFARHGHELVLVARRRERLDALAAEIADAGRPAPLVLPLDLSQADAAERIAAALETHRLEAQYVVNNAGFGLVGRTAALDLAEQLAIIDVNMRALMDLSLAFAGSLERHRGGVLNVGSVAGFLPGPRSAVYYASKAFVLSFSEALHAELAPRGIRVTALCPGPVTTEFQARAGVPNEVISWPLGQSVRRVAEAGYRGLMRGRRVVVPGFGNRLVTALPRLMPRSLLLAMLDRRQAGRQQQSGP